LIDWDPRYLYRKIFKTEDEVAWFLENICTAEWNDQQDAGRSFEEATNELIAKHPEYREPIAAWYARWQETISGPIAGTVDILKAIKESEKFRLYALTNWSAETFLGRWRTSLSSTGLRESLSREWRKPESLCLNSFTFCSIATRSSHPKHSLSTIILRISTEQRRWV